MWKVLTCWWAGCVFIGYLPPQACCLLSAVPWGLQHEGWNICSCFNGAWNTTEEPSFLRWNPLPRATSLLFHFSPFGIHVVDIGKCCYLFKRASPLPILSPLTPHLFPYPSTSISKQQRWAWTSVFTSTISQLPPLVQKTLSVLIPSLGTFPGFGQNFG